MQKKQNSEKSNTVQIDKIEENLNVNSAKTLDECIEYAIINNIEVRNKKIDFQITQEKIKEFRSDGLPKVDLNITGVNNLVLQKSKE